MWHVQLPGKAPRTALDRRAEEGSATSPSEVQGSCGEAGVRCQASGVRHSPGTEAVGRVPC